MRLSSLKHTMNQNTLSESPENETGQTVWSEFDRVSRVAKERERRAKLALERKCDAIMDELGLNPETKLAKHEVKLILELLGLELNEYQKNELNAVIDRAHCFNSRSLKYWLAKNRNFILCKVLGVNVKKIQNKSTFLTSGLPPVKDKFLDEGHKKHLTNTVVLPEIKPNRRAQSYQKRSVPIERTAIGDYVELVKKNKNIRETFQKKLEQTLERQKKISGEEGREYAKKVRERLRKCMKEQQEEYVKNVELLALMQKYCCQMQRFRNIMLSDNKVDKGLL